MKEYKTRHKIVTETLGKGGTPLNKRRRERPMEEWEEIVFEMFSMGTPDLRVKMLEAASVVLLEYLNGIFASVEPAIGTERVRACSVEVARCLKTRIDEMKIKQLPIKEIPGVESGELNHP